MKRSLTFSLILTCFFTVGCSQTRDGGLDSSLIFPVAPVMAPPGMLFEQTSVPLMHEQNDGESKQTLQSGRASAKFFAVPIIGPILSFGWQDASIKEASLNGGIRQLHHADIEQFNILGIYRETTVIAYGTR
jgi:hypothetical protein